MEMKIVKTKIKTKSTGSKVGRMGRSRKWLQGAREADQSRNGKLKIPLTNLSAYESGLKGSFGALLSAIAHKETRFQSLSFN